MRFCVAEASEVDPRRLRDRLGFCPDRVTGGMLKASTLKC